MKKFLLTMLFCLVATPYIAHAENVQGFYTFEMTADKNGTDMTSDVQMNNADTQYCTGVFADSSLTFKLNFQPTYLGINIQNNGSRTVRVDWENSAYINHNNNSFRIFHSGITIADRDKEQPTTPIIRGTSLNDMFIPTVNVTYSTYFNRWMYLYLMDFKNGGEDGKTVKAMITILDGEVTNEYIFTFRMKYHKAKTKTYFTASNLEVFK